jgi:hypothetical protein
MNCDPARIDWGNKLTNQANPIIKNKPKNKIGNVKTAKIYHKA